MRMQQDFFNETEMEKTERVLLCKNQKSKDRQFMEANKNLIR